MRPALDRAQDEAVVGEVDVPDGNALTLVVVQRGGEDGGELTLALTLLLALALTW